MMKRTHFLLAVLAAILLVAVFWLLMWQPKQQEIDATREETVAVQEQQQLLQTEIVRLRTVREQAPEAEAQLAAASAIVPEGSALPSFLRQVQTAADDAGIVLSSVGVGRPPEADGTGALVSLPVSLAAEGSYFQLVDFLRRLEAPDITPRGVLWDSISVTPTDYPLLAAGMAGRIFATSTGASAVVDEELETDVEGEDDEGLEPDVEGEDDPDANPAVEVEP